MTIVSAVPGRVRVKVAGRKEFLELRKSVVRSAKNVSASFNGRTQRALFVYDVPLAVYKKEQEDVVTQQLKNRFPAIPQPPSLPVVSNCPFSAEMSRQRLFLNNQPLWIGFKELLAFLFVRLAVPHPFRPVFAFFYIYPAFVKGLKSVRRFRFDHDLLDACSMILSVLFGDLRLVTSIGFLVRLNEKLEQWMQQQSVVKLESMARYLLRDFSTVLVDHKGRPREVAAIDIKEGDSVICRAGMRVAIDGYVCRGHAVVDESLVTSQATVVSKKAGAKVLAGSVIVSGDIVVCCTKDVKNTQLMNITQKAWLKERNEASKPSRAETLSHKMSKVSFAGSALIYLLTRNMRFAAAALMVDYSCILRLVIPFCYQSGIMEVEQHGLQVKGGAVLENLSLVDAVLIRDRGVLTEDLPQVVDIFAMDAESPQTILAKTACLAEHFTNRSSVALTQYALGQGIEHEEEHGEVEYVKDHGLVAMYQGKRLVFGNRHFLEDDQGIDLSNAQSYVEKQNSDGAEVLFLAENGKCIGAVAIREVLRQEAACVLGQLKKLDIQVAVYSDREGSLQQKLAQDLGVMVVSGASFATKGVAQGGWGERNVAVITDCTKDEYIAQQASVVVSLPHKSPIVQHRCDLMLHDSLIGLTQALHIARKTSVRIKKTTSWGMGSNLLLFVFGFRGAVNPALLSVAHNALTAGACMSALRPLDRKGRGKCCCGTLPPSMDVVS